MRLDFLTIDGEDVDAPAGFLELSHNTVSVTENLAWVIDLESLPGDQDYRPEGGFTPSASVDGVATFTAIGGTWDGEAWMRSIPPHFRMPYLRPVWHEPPES
jgi:hypothetical protein